MKASLLLLFPATLLLAGCSAYDPSISYAQYCEDLDDVAFSKYSGKGQSVLYTTKDETPKDVLERRRYRMIYDEPRPFSTASSNSGYGYSAGGPVEGPGYGNFDRSGYDSRNIYSKMTPAVAEQFRIRELKTANGYTELSIQDRIVESPKWKSNGNILLTDETSRAADTDASTPLLLRRDLANQLGTAQAKERDATKTLETAVTLQNANAKAIREVVDNNRMLAEMNRQQNEIIKNQQKQMDALTKKISDIENRSAPQETATTKARATLSPLQ